METLIYAIFPKQFSLNITRKNKKRENQPMKENKKLVGKILKSVAKVSSESASIFCFYEPKMPMQLLKEKQTKKSCHKVNKSV